MNDILYTGSCKRLVLQICTENKVWNVDYIDGVVLVQAIKSLLYVKRLNDDAKYEQVYIPINKLAFFKIIDEPEEEEEDGNT